MNSDERILAARMRRQAIEDGHIKGTPPEVGRRVSTKPHKVRHIRSLAEQGLSCSQIAKRTGLWESGVRRYAYDYGIEMKKGPPGGPSAEQLRAIRRRRAKVRRFLERGWTQRAIAKELGVTTFTICSDAQHVRQSEDS